MTQSQKFDPEGQYIKQYVPELKNLAPKELFAPWEVDLKKLEASGVMLGETYPKPIVDLKASREEALEAYNTIKG